MGEKYWTSSGLLPQRPLPAPSNLRIVLPDIRLTWDGMPGLTFNVYRAVDGAPMHPWCALIGRRNYQTPAAKIE